MNPRNRCGIFYTHRVASVILSFFLSFFGVFDAKRPLVQADLKHFPFKSFEEISSEVLTNTKEIAESYLCDTVTSTAVTVPALFNDSQRQATTDAGKSGLTVLRIINEPAPTLSRRRSRARVTSSSFSVDPRSRWRNPDVSLLTMEEGIFEVGATAGDTRLGGEDCDSRLVNHFVQEFRLKHKKDISSNPRALRYLCTTSIEIDSLFEGIDTCTPLTRARFEELCQDLLCSTLDPVEKVFRYSNRQVERERKNVPVGGSTRIPPIVRLVSDFFDGKEPNKSINPYEAVAYGAAVRLPSSLATLRRKLRTYFSTSRRRHLSMSYLSLHLCTAFTDFASSIETSGGVMTPPGKHNTAVATKNSEIFSTYADSLVSSARSSRSELSGTPPAPRGVPQIEVTFDIDADSMLDASDKTTGKSNRITITNDKGRLSKEEIERMVNDAEKYKAEDEDAAARITTKNDLESYAYNLRNSLQDARGQIKLASAINDTISWLDASQEASKEEYEERQKELESIAHPRHAEALRRGGRCTWWLPRRRTGRLPWWRTRRRAGGRPDG
ncbi:unnamed protein product [Peniophora sp. CBMAI 1063]|nr:unnamed protein product [Peniophora sp. CBMAI 1063]